MQDRRVRSVLLTLVFQWYPDTTNTYRYDTNICMKIHINTNTDRCNFYQIGKTIIMIYNLYHTFTLRIVYKYNEAYLLAILIAIPWNHPSLLASVLVSGTVWILSNTPPEQTVLLTPPEQVESTWITVQNVGSLFIQQVRNMRQVQSLMINMMML